MPGFVHLIQIEPHWQDRVSSHVRAHALIKKALPQAGDLVVLPEMFSTSFCMDASATVQGVEAEDEAFLSRLAHQYQVFILGGVVTASEAGMPFNQAVAFNPAGDLLARYSKERLFGYTGEADHYSPGGGTVGFEWAGMKVGMRICYDLRFPELARDSLRSGAETLVYIAAWPVKRIQHWITLLQARAIENQAFVVGVNRCGSDPNFTYGGRSIVVDPYGVVIADAGGFEGSVRARLDAKAVRGWREEFPSVREFLGSESADQ
jgi:predicted amidohydrolase